MPAEKKRLTFISYSRADKDFALQLARELRSSGFHIWLDQLDIPTGARWDDEVEKALTNCDIFMIILTHNSTVSNNVKDEIGYAIDSNKRILPILLENVNVPLRLRRFQYVDFSAKNFAEGIESAKQLLRTLANEPTEPGVVRAEPPSPRPVPGPVARGRRKSSSLAIPLLTGGMFLSIVVLAALMLLWPNSPFAIVGKPTLATAQQPTLPRSTTDTPTPTSVASFTPTATHEPSPTFTLTSPPSPTATMTPFSPTEPDQFLNFYFDTLIYQDNYELAWSLLSDAFQSKKTKGFAEWKKVWEQVFDWQRPAWTVSSTPTTAFVSAPEIWFLGKTWYAIPDAKYCLTYDEQRNTWLIDLSSACGQ